MPTSIPIRKIVVATVLLAALVGCRAKGGDGNPGPTGPTPPPTPGVDIFYTAIGASDALGVGSSVPCLPLTPCTGGTGYVPRLVRALAVGRKVTLTNLGLPTAAISPAFQALGNRYGRSIEANIIDRALPFVPRNSTLITVFAGANDVNTVSAAIGGGAAGTDIRGYITTQVGVFATDYRRLINGLRDRAPMARIVVANIPNFAGMPFTAGFSVDRRRVLQQISVSFAARVNDVVAQGIPVVDLLCDPRSYDRGTYSSDGFHPDDSGYAFLASELEKAVLSTSYPAPRSTCPEMTFVPAL